MGDDVKGKAAPKKTSHKPSKKHGENDGYRSDNLRANLLRRKQQKKERQD